MINYKLAKELKEAGFPMENRVDYSNEYDNDEDGLGGCAYCESPTFGHGSNSVLLPTLSELIEACGEKFHSLHKYVDADGWHGWIAQEANAMGDDIITGKTPEEAVARLWLALNK